MIRPFSASRPAAISAFNVHLGIGEALRDFGQNTGLIRGFDREHICLKREHARFAQGHERLGGIAHNHAHNSVIDSIRRGQRVNVDPGVGQRVTHPRKCARTISKENSELGSRFYGNPRSCCWKLMLGSSSDN